MEKRRMTKKALNLADHKSRLASAGAVPSPATAWRVALAALAAGLLLLFLLK